METSKIELNLFCFIIAMIILIDLAVTRLLSWTGISNLSVIGVTRMMEILFTLIIVKKWGGGLHNLGLIASKIADGFKAGIIWSIAFGGVAAIGMMAIFLSGLNPLLFFKTQRPDQIKDVIMLIMIGGVIGPVAEEIVFRGIVYGFFRKWGAIVAILTSTTLFAIIHLISQGIHLTHIIGGIVFAVSYEVSRNLITPITIHIIGNVTIFLISMITA